MKKSPEILLSGEFNLSSDFSRRKWNARGHLPYCKSNNFIHLIELTEINYVSKARFDLFVFM